MVAQNPVALCIVELVYFLEGRLMHFLRSHDAHSERDNNNSGRSSRMESLSGSEQKIDRDIGLGNSRRAH